MDHGWSEHTSGGRRIENLGKVPMMMGIVVNCSVRASKCRHNVASNMGRYQEQIWRALSAVTKIFRKRSQFGFNVATRSATAAAIALGRRESGNRFLWRYLTNLLPCLRAFEDAWGSRKLQRRRYFVSDLRRASVAARWCDHKLLLPKRTKGGE